MTQTARQDTQSTLHGALSGDGTDVMRATVYLAPIPARPPAYIADALTPVHDQAGHLRDWRLSPDPHVAMPSAADIGNYLHWRSHFVSDHFLGERAFVRAFAEHAARHDQTSTLAALTNHRTCFDAAAMMKLAYDADRMRQALESEEHDDGLGIYTSGATAPARGLLIADEPVTVLGLGDTRVTASRRGLTLEQRSEQEWDPTQVTGWRVESDDVEASTPSGSVDLGRSDAARLLLMIGRQSDVVEVRPTPAHTLLAPLFRAIHETSRQASECRSQVEIRAGWD
jgi:hypothetical protein